MFTEMLYRAQGSQNWMSSFEDAGSQATTRMDNYGSLKANQNIHIKLEPRSTQLWAK